jgi:Cys-tRNA synthase (O-phospho-L-seryl-tRNA:Cys-tRNA synthase)
MNIDVRKLCLILKHSADVHERNEARRLLLEKLTSALTTDEAKYILTMIENYIDLQERYSKLRNELDQARELVKELNKVFNI